MPRFAVTVREHRRYGVVVEADTLAEAIFKGIELVETDQFDADQVSIDMENCDAEDIGPAVGPFAGLSCAIPQDGAGDRGQSRPGNGDNT